MARLSAESAEATVCGTLGRDRGEVIRLFDDMDGAQLDDDVMVPNIANLLSTAHIGLSFT